jgi:hypothetical protein
LDPIHQLYAQVIFPYANGYLGLVAVAEVSEKPIVGPGFPPKGGHVNRVRCALQWSDDLLHWKMVEPGKVCR